jgi:hypothetical protein
MRWGGQATAGSWSQVSTTVEGPVASASLSSVHIVFGKYFKKIIFLN